MGKVYVIFRKCNVDCVKRNTHIANMFHVKYKIIVHLYDIIKVKSPTSLCMHSVYEYKSYGYHCFPNQKIHYPNDSFLRNKG